MFCFSIFPKQDICLFFLQKKISNISSNLSGGFVLIEPDPWLLGLSVALDGPDRAEVLDELGDLGLEGQTLNEDLHLGANAGGVRVRLLEPTTTAATANPTMGTRS